MIPRLRDSALVVVDMLYDFIDGSMACENAFPAIEASLRFIESVTSGAEPAGDGITGVFPILFVRDSHPAGHCSFTPQGGPWPPHCVKGTHGADIFESLLPYVSEELSFYKGEDPAMEQYSGFDGRSAAGQSLSEVLTLLGIENVIVCGIATEFCVRNTAEDLLKAGFSVSILKDGLAWVDAAGHKEAIEAMKQEGICFFDSK